jgi:hypothetical protein
MIKEKYIELIRSNIFGGSATVDRLYLADQRRIELDIAAALNTLFFQTFKKEPSNLDRYAKTYLNVAVLYEASTDTHYSILPAKVIQYPTVGDGIWNISTMLGKDVEFTPIETGNKEFLFENEFDSLDDVIGYSLSGSRISYYNFDPIITAVKMDLVVDFTEWGMTEDVPIPSGQDLEVINIIRQMYNLQPKDTINNQNPVA